MMRDGMGTRLRLLPWTTPEGGPCYLSTSDPNSRLSCLADELETELLDSAEFVLGQVKPLLADQAVGERELRFTGVRLAEALGDALRIAVSRGGAIAGELETMEISEIAKLKILRRSPSWWLQDPVCRRSVMASTG